MELMELLERVLNITVDWTMRITELIGVIVLAVAVIRGLEEYVRRKPDAVKIMGEGMTTALSFLLAGEILRTVTIGSIYDIAIVAGIIALRSAIVVLIHWEHKHPHQGRERAPKHPKHEPEKHEPEKQEPEKQEPAQIQH